MVLAQRSGGRGSGGQNVPTAPQQGAAPDRRQFGSFCGSSTLLVVGRDWAAAGELGRSAAARSLIVLQRYSVDTLLLYMLIEKIEALDLILRCKHSETYASLRPSKEVDSSLTAPLRDWYQWKNGQKRETKNMFFDHYRFFSYEEARELCVVQTEYSLPLLTDYAGEGYYFSTLNRRMFYNAATFYDKEDLLFSSFESFLDFLIELADSPSHSIGEFIEAEEALLSKYTRS